MKKKYFSAVIDIEEGGEIHPWPGQEIDEN